jgi:hypothetical protein
VQALQLLDEVFINHAVACGSCTIQAPLVFFTVMLQVIILDACVSSQAGGDGNLGQLFVPYMDGRAHCC